MIRYQCDYCNTGFDKPVTITHKEYLGQHMLHVYDEERCPICGESSFHEVTTCPDCGRPMDFGDVICKHCASNYIKMLDDCFDHFTAAGEEWFNQNIDGDVIENRKQWGC